MLLCTLLILSIVKSCSGNCLDLFNTGGFNSTTEFERAQIRLLLTATPSVYTTITGNIKSPKFPFKLNNNVFYHCLYTIRAPEGSVIRIRFKKMGTPASDLTQMLLSSNFTGTATLSVLDGEGIFGGEYKRVYYFEKKPRSFISATNVVTLHLFGQPDKKDLKEILGLGKKTTTTSPFANDESSNEIAEGGEANSTDTPDADGRINPLNINLKPKKSKSLGQYFKLTWDFVDVRLLGIGASSVLELPGAVIDLPGTTIQLPDAESFVPTLGNVLRGIRLALLPITSLN